MYFFTRKPGEVKENRSKETQGTQPTEESLAWLRLFLAVFGVGCSLAYNHTFLNAVVQHLIHTQGKEKADPWRQHVCFLLQAIPRTGAFLQCISSVGRSASPIHHSKTSGLNTLWFGREILLPRPFSQLVWSVNPIPDLMDLNYLQLPPLCTTT